MADGILQVPAPTNEPVLSYAPGTPERRAIVSELDRMASESIEIPARIGGSPVTTGRIGEATACRTITSTCSRAGTSAAPRRSTARFARLSRRATRLVAHAVAAPRRDLPQGRRPARRPVPPCAQRRDDARPVEDRAPGRDRRGVRADRLLPLQRAYMRRDLRGAARLVARLLELPRAPAARGLRVRGHAVQLHEHRGQPAHRPGADGQHGRVEAGVLGDLLGPLHHGAARGGGSAPRRRSTWSPDRVPRSAIPCSTSPDLAGIHFTGSTGVFKGMWATIGRNIRALPVLSARSSARRAARTSCSPTRRPTFRRSSRRSCAARSNTRGRSAPPPRARTSRARSGRGSRRCSSRSWRRSASATRAISRTSWAP